jgi:hypothetical protein
VEGFKEQWQEDQVKGNVVDLALVRATLIMTVLTGTISPPPDPSKIIKTLADGQRSETSPDEFGRFELNVAALRSKKVTTLECTQ